MESSVDRLPVIPKRVTAQQQPQFWPDMTMPHHPTVQPIWGHAVTELFDGGDPWNPHAEPEIARKPNGTPRNLRMTPSPYKGGEYEVEPDPAISSKTKTGHLVRAMWRAGWTRDQAEAALMNWVHDGGLYLRWRSSEKFLDYLWENTALTDTDPYFCKRPADVLSSPCNSGSTGTAITGKEEKGGYQFKADPRKEGEILRWLRQHPNTPQDRLLEANLVHPRLIRRYLDGLEADGLITSVRKKVQGASGLRHCRVWEIVPIASETLPPTWDLEDLLADADVVQLDDQAR